MCDEVYIKIGCGWCISDELLSQRKYGFEICGNIVDFLLLCLEDKVWGEYNTT